MNEYVYCANNPITFIDPDGDIPIVLVAMVAWNMYNIYSTAKDAKSFAKKPTLGGGIMVIAGVTPVGKIRTAGKVAKSAKNTVVAIEKIEKHHIFPKYLGGPKNGALVPLPKSYHQKITTAFRNEVKYGSEAQNYRNWAKTNPKKWAKEVKIVMKKVYKKYPIKKYLKKK